MIGALQGSLPTDSRIAIVNSPGWHLTWQAQSVPDRKWRIEPSWGADIPLLSR